MTVASTRTGTICAPHISVCAFELPGEIHSVTNRGGHQPLTQTGTQFRQILQVICQAGCYSYIPLRIIGNEFIESQITEQAKPYA